ncbi:MAG TPA: M20 family metallo-hydrolase, partial [Gemmatimonadales bacterium]|nr:M20 family metallo-hydrolase [Gemmatimonadales bacterium]
MRIDGGVALLERRLDELYAIGAEPEGGGTYRPLYGAAWAAAGERVERWMKDAGLKTHRDAVGNVWGRAAGNGKSIVTGSHIDTVRHGGRLDGALGIVAGLTAVAALLKEKGNPRRPLEVVAICEEEGSRFATNFWGSRAITGAIDTVDADIAAAMAERGLDPAKIAIAARDDIDTFIELHIEQGAVLDASRQPLAVVSAIVGTAHLELTVTGRPDHAGTTPMELRKDALAGAAAMLQAIESIARSLGRPAVATVGRLRVEPDQVNVVPGKVVFTVDLRHSDLGGGRALEERIRSLCGTISQERRLDLAIRTLQERPPVAMHPDVRALLARVARECGVQATELVSGAGHDAQILAARYRVGMLFVPSIGGRSHCPEEATAPEHL